MCVFVSLSVAAPVCQYEPADTMELLHHLAASVCVSPLQRLQQGSFYSAALSNTPHFPSQRGLGKPDCSGKTRRDGVLLQMCICAKCLMQPRRGNSGDGIADPPKHHLQAEVSRWLWIKGERITVRTPGGVRGMVPGMSRLSTTRHDRSRQIHLVARSIHNLSALPPHLTHTHRRYERPALDVRARIPSREPHNLTGVCREEFRS